MSLLIFLIFHNNIVNTERKRRYLSVPTMKNTNKKTKREKERKNRKEVDTLYNTAVGSLIH